MRIGCCLVYTSPDTRVQVPLNFVLLTSCVLRNTLRQQFTVLTMFCAQAMYENKTIFLLMGGSKRVVTWGCARAAFLLHESFSTYCTLKQIIRVINFLYFSARISVIVLSVGRALFVWFSLVPIVLLQPHCISIQALIFHQTLRRDDILRYDATIRIMLCPGVW